MTTQPSPQDPQSPALPELTIDLGEDRRGRPERSRYRPTRKTIATTALTVTAAAGVLAFAYVTGDAQPGVTGQPQPAPSTAAVSEPRLRYTDQFITPELAAAGERVTVVAYRNVTLCGPAELRFDGAAVPHRLTRYAAGQDRRSNPQFFMWMDVPRSARPGTHHIDLFGPVRAYRGNICTDVPERQARIATATITIENSGR
jgi:hypothetical protein